MFHQVLIYISINFVVLKLIWRKNINVSKDRWFILDISRPAKSWTLRSFKRAGPGLGWDTGYRLSYSHSLYPGDKWSVSAWIFPIFVCENISPVWPQTTSDHHFDLTRLLLARFLVTHSITASPPWPTSTRPLVLTKTAWVAEPGTRGGTPGGEWEPAWGSSPSATSSTSLSSMTNSNITNSEKSGLWCHSSFVCELWVIHAFIRNAL